METMTVDERADMLNMARRHGGWMALGHFGRWDLMTMLIEALGHVGAARCSSVRAKPSYHRIGVWYVIVEVTEPTSEFFRSEPRVIALVFEMNKVDVGVLGLEYWVLSEVDKVQW